MEEREKNQLLRQLPSVDELIGTPEAKALEASFGRSALTRAARRAVAEARSVLLAGGFVAPSTLLSAELQRALTPGLRQVINASGVVLHTNLGRAPLAQAAIAAMAEVAATATWSWTSRAVSAARASRRFRPCSASSRARRRAWS